MAWRPLTPLCSTIALALVLGCGSSGSGNGSGNDGFNPDGTPQDPFGDDPIPGENVCADLLVSVNGVTPTVTLLIDQSGSMDANFGGTDRWNAVYDTLMRPNGVVERLENDVRFGLSLYTSFDGNEGGTCPILTSMPPALNNHQAINGIYDAADPQDETPTGAALTAVSAQLQSFSEPGPKIIVLGTDGEPDTCAEPNPQNGQGEAIAAAQAAFDAGIRTFIVSVGDDVGADHLQDMANAGVGLPVNGPDNAPFYRALNPQELIDAFDQIIGGVTGCVFTLDGEVDPTKGGQGRVAVDGEELEVGTDWRLIDGRTFEILGEACEKIQDGNDHAVAAVFPCGAVIIE